MKRPKVGECLAEIRRLKAENERLQRLVDSQPLDRKVLRHAATTLRDLAFYFENQAVQVGEVRDALNAALGHDDLPSFDELRGILSDGRERVYQALESEKVEHRS